MFVLAFMFMGFQAEAQNYVAPEQALQLLDQAIDEVKESDYNWTAPTSNGVALFPPHKLKKVYLEVVQIRIKATDDTAQGITQGHNAFADKFPNQASQWANGFRNDTNALLQQ